MCWFTLGIAGFEWGKNPLDPPLMAQSSEIGERPLGVELDLPGGSVINARAPSISPPPPLRPRPVSSWIVSVPHGPRSDRS